MDARATVTPEGFGERLRQLRSAAAISQDELARRSGLSTAGVGALERGTRRAPQRETIVRIADALSLDKKALADLEQAAERGRARSRTPNADTIAAPHNLPVQLTSFVGRAEHVDRIGRRIEASRLVTVVGSGGVGKTRVALEVATRRTSDAREEVRFVDLAPLGDGGLISGRIAAVLGLGLSGAGDALDLLARALEARRVLLVFDNCEHLIVDVTETARVLLQRCPEVRILATSRERLGIIGEVVHRLPPMALPDPSRRTIAAARESSALELFVQRAQSADPDVTFIDEQTPVLIDVCRRLEGIPLAIELAAARIPTLGLEALSRRLAASFDGASGMHGLPDRQQTMRDTIAWSYDLLSEPERSLLRRLGIFAGGCTLEAAEAVCSASDLQSARVAGMLAALVDKSLVNAIIDGERMRYVLLDSTRAFARERLVQAGELSAFSRRHAQWLAAYGDRVGRAYLSQPNLIWLDEFLPEIDNVRRALEWALNSPNDVDVLLAGQIAGSFRGLWLIPGSFHECRQWITAVLGRIDEAQQPLVSANLLNALVQTLAGSEQLAVYERLVSALRQVNDPLRLARALSHFAIQHCRNGLLLKAQGEIDEAREILAKQPMSEKPSPRLQMTAMSVLISCFELAFARRDFAEARVYLERGAALAENLGDRFVLTNISILHAELEFVAGNISLASTYSEEAVKRANAAQLSSALLSRALSVDAAIRLNMPDPRSGDAAARHAYRVTRPLGDDYLALLSHQNLAATAAHRGFSDIAARLLGSIEAWCESIEYQRNSFDQMAYELLLALLSSQLGTDARKRIAEGRQLNLESAAQEALAIESGTSVLVVES